jgi:hypothetical protein
VHGSDLDLGTRFLPKGKKVIAKMAAKSKSNLQKNQISSGSFIQGDRMRLRNNRPESSPTLFLCRNA